MISRATEAVCSAFRQSKINRAVPSSSSFRSSTLTRSRKYSAATFPISVALFIPLPASMDFQHMRSRLINGEAFPDFPVAAPADESWLGKLSYQIHLYLECIPLLCHRRQIHTAHKGARETHSTPFFG